MPDQQQQQQPRLPLVQTLWEAMDIARYLAFANGGKSTAARAAEIRAVADYLEALWAAQSPAPEIDDKDMAGFFAGMKTAQEIHREGTLNILRREARRAEAGE